MPKSSSARVDPYRRFNFILEIDGIARAGFSEVGGLSAETEVVEYREGADPANTVRKLPGLTKFPNITLKPGDTLTLHGTPNNTEPSPVDYIEITK